jgi:hypothetical protein
VLIGLTVAAEGVNRRSAWTAWQSTTGRRCGRWSGLLAAGARIRSASPENYQAYAKPPPIEEKWTQTARGQWQRSLHDPEEDAVAPATV